MKNKYAYKIIDYTNKLKWFVTIGQCFCGNGQESGVAVFAADLALLMAIHGLLQMRSSFTLSEQQGSRTRYGFLRLTNQMEINRFL